jgi:hypothetical protein
MGDEYSLALHDTDKPLVVVSFTLLWRNDSHDETVKYKTLEAIEKIKTSAVERGIDHLWRYLNHCGALQKLFTGYGDEN